MLRKKPPPPSLDVISLHTHSGVLLLIPLIALLSFKWSHLHLSSSPFKRPQILHAALRLRPRCGPPSPGLSYPESPPQISSAWPGGCRAEAPFSPRSSAARRREKRKLQTVWSERLTRQTKLRGNHFIHDKIPTMTGCYHLYNPNFDN